MAIYYWLSPLAALPTFNYVRGTLAGEIEIYSLDLCALSCGYPLRDVKKLIGWGDSGTFTRHLRLLNDIREVFPSGVAEKGQEIPSHPVFHPTGRSPLAGLQAIDKQIITLVQ